MTKSEMLDVITRARVLLEKHYVQWTTDDGHGGHCQAGCLRIAQCGNSMGVILTGGGPRYIDNAPDDFISETAHRLHPELAAASALHQRSGFRYSFGEYPAVFVNNELGKQAILAVYDEAIETLQVAVLCELEAAKAASVSVELSPLEVMQLEHK